MSFLLSVIGFVLAVGILVAFHEYGHFWVARRLGVKVLRYSIGFGKPLLSWRGRSGETEYVVSAIPLGGYVKMLDEREGEVAPEERHRAFNVKPLATRFAIVAAGPLANFLFALIAYWAIFVIGSTELRPIIGEVLPESPAELAGLQPGDEITRVGGSDVHSWQQALLALLGAGVDRRELEIQVEREGRPSRHSLDLRQTPALGDDPDYLSLVGIRPSLPAVPPVLGRILPDSAAARAGLSAGDHIVTLNAEPVGSWEELVAAVRQRPGEEVELGVRREGALRLLQVTLDAQEAPEGQIGALGVAPHIPDDLYADLRREVRYGPLAAMVESARATWDASLLTVKVLYRMVVGQASLKNLSGPINIAQYAGDSVSLGLVPFLKFLAIVSISLGILNLLPVPVLDGGHLLYYAIEGIRGRPLSEQAQIVGQQIGIFLLLMLMGLAIYNDIARLLG
jgi:regulator of sigma E protease